MRKRQIDKIVEEVNEDMVLKWKRENKILKQRISKLETTIEEYHNLEYVLLLELESIANAGKLEPESAWFLCRLLDWKQIPSFAGLKEKVLGILEDKATEEK